MKFLIMFIVLNSALYAFNQEREDSKVLFLKKENLLQSVEKGEFNFQLSKNSSAKEVLDGAKYYTMYFTVEFDDASKIVKLRMLKNDSNSRHIICRYLSVLSLEKIKVDDKLFVLEDFYQTFLK